VRNEGTFSLKIACSREIIGAGWDRSITGPGEKHMLRSLLLGVAALSVVGALPAAAAPCRDAKGKFIKCPTTAPAKPKQCRLNGKFAKCSTPGAKPVS
jgi:hypothetical protein